MVMNVAVQGILRLAPPTFPSDHLSCADTFAWSRGCPFMTGTTVHTSLVTMPLIIVKQYSTLTGRGVARSLDDSDGGGVMLLLLLSCRRSSVMSRPVFGSTIARPRFSRFWYGPPPPVDIGRCCCCCGCCCCWGCCGGCCGCCGCCCCCCGTCCCCCCGGCCWTAATIVGCCCCVG